MVDHCGTMVFEERRRSPSTGGAGNAGNAGSGYFRRLSEAALPIVAAAARGAARCAAHLSAPVDCCSVQKAPAERNVPEQAAAVLQRPSMPAPFSSPATGSTAFPTKEPSNQAKPAEEDGLDETMHVKLLISRAVGLPKADFLGTADPYVEVRLVRGDPLCKEKGGVPPEKIRKAKSKALDSRTRYTAKTSIIRGELAPRWDETFDIAIPIDDTLGDVFLYLRVFDYDLVGSDDFLAHVSLSLLDSMASSMKLSAGWKALLRGCSSAAEKLSVLRDERLDVQPPFGARLLPVPGQEDTYDLSAAEVFIRATLVPDAPQAPNATRRSQGVIASPQRPPGTSASSTSAELLQLQEDLACAAAQGDVSTVLRTLRSGCAVNVRSQRQEFDGCTALHISCLKGRADLAMALVDVFDASLVARGPGGRTAAMYACEGSDEALAEWLITEGVPADLTDDKGRTVLFYAVSAALPQLTSWLIGKQHLAVNEKATDGSTPLQAACSSRVAAAAVVAQQLLEAKATANAADQQGRTPLHEACEAADDKLVRLLLSTGKARKDAVDAVGRTPGDLAPRQALPSGAGLSESTVKRLRPTRSKSAEAADDAGRQRRGETAEDAARRQNRARKAANSEQVPNDWRTWRVMHPRLSPETSSGDGEGAAAGEIYDDWAVLAPGLQTDRCALVASGKAGLAPWQRPLDSVEVTNIVFDRGGAPVAAPLFVGQADSAAAATGSKGRIGRMKNWAASVMKRSSSSPPKSHMTPSAPDPDDFDPPAEDLSARRNLD